MKTGVGDPRFATWTTDTERTQTLDYRDGVIALTRILSRFAETICDQRDEILRLKAPEPKGPLSDDPHRWRRFGPNPLEWEPELLIRRSTEIATALAADNWLMSGAIISALVYRYNQTRTG